MFDRIMENSMAVWMLVSLAFPIFFFGTLIKACLHFRKLRRAARLAGFRMTAPTRPQTVGAREDWVPSR